MQLFHYTIPENALLIGLGNGLTPKIPKDASMQTMGTPVVWLTKGEPNDNSVTPELIAHWEKTRFTDHGRKVGDPIFGGRVCCTVEVERSRHLIRWVEFLRNTDIVAVDPDTGREVTGREVLDFYYRSNPNSNHTRYEKWWLCTRPIPAKRIWVPMTREQGIEGCDWHINWHKEKANADGVEQWTNQREAFAELSPGQRLALHDGSCFLLNEARAA